MVQEDVRRPYVDFAYYKNDYGGTQIKTENDFKRAESISEAFVNQVTFGRIARYQISLRLLYFKEASKNGR